MKQLLALTDDLAILPHHISAVRRVDDDQCAVYLVGQSAIDGSFLVDRDFDDVVEEINDGLAREAED